MDLNKLEKQAMEMMKMNSKRSQGMTNKTILVELLMNGEYNRALAPVKAASLYFKKMNQEPTETEYFEKITSIKNSLDTLISNYNNEEKVKRDSLIVGTTLNNKMGMISITK